MQIAKITCRYPHGLRNLDHVGIWQINVKKYLWGVIPYWKVIEEIPQLDIDMCPEMNLPNVLKRIAQLGLKVEERR